jgi:hypothetical protein
MRSVAFTLMICLGLSTQAIAAEENPNAPTPRMAIKFLHEQVPHYGGYNHWDTFDDNGYKVSRNNVTKVKIENNALNLSETILERGAKEIDGKTVFKALATNIATTIPLKDLNPESVIHDEVYGARLEIRCQNGPCLTVAVLEALETEAEGQFFAFRRVKSALEEMLESNAKRTVSKTNSVSISFIERPRAERVSRALAYLVRETQKP